MVGSVELDSAVMGSAVGRLVGAVVGAAAVMAGAVVVD